MAFLPIVVRADHRGGFRIHLVFNDAMEATVDFERWLQGAVFEPLKEPRYFSRFFVEGGTVVWPNGADVAPETLYAAAAAERSIHQLHSRAAIAGEQRTEYKTRQKRRRG